MSKLRKLFQSNSYRLLAAISYQPVLKALGGAFNLSLKALAAPFVLPYRGSIWAIKRIGPSIDYATKIPGKIQQIYQDSRVENSITQTLKRFGTAIGLNLLDTFVKTPWKGLVSKVQSTRSFIDEQAGIYLKTLQYPEVQRMNKIKPELKRALRDKLKEEWVRKVQEHEKTHVKQLQKDKENIPKEMEKELETFIKSRNFSKAKIDELRTANAEAIKAKLEEVDGKLATPFEPAIKPDEFNKVFNSAVYIRFDKDVISNGRDSNTITSSQFTITFSKEFADKCRKSHLELKEALNSEAKSFLKGKIRGGEKKIPTIVVEEKPQRAPA